MRIILPHSSPIPNKIDDLARVLVKLENISGNFFDASSFILLLIYFLT